MKIDSKGNLTDELDYMEPMEKLSDLERDQLINIVEKLKRTNTQYAEKSEAFDRLNVKRIAEGARRGGADADEIYQTALRMEAMLTYVIF